MKTCDCMDVIRGKLESHHGEGSKVELCLVPVMILNREAENCDMTVSLPPLYYTYRVGKNRRKSHVTFNFCPFCGQEENKPTHDFASRELTPVKGRAPDPAEMTGITGKHDREETKAPTAGARPVPDL